MRGRGNRLSRRSEGAKGPGERARVRHPKERQKKKKTTKLGARERRTVCVLGSLSLVNGMA